MTYMFLYNNMKQASFAVLCQVQDATDHLSTIHTVIPIASLRRSCILLCLYPRRPLRV